MSIYKSPPHKLISFFKRSRDQWKEKYQDLKRVAKYLNNRIYFLTRSKEHWKDKAKQLEQELLRKDIEFSKEQKKILQENEAFKKK